nr:MAG TPA: hypothetical protein [Caudoviricetes sp.]
MLKHRENLRNKASHQCSSFSIPNPQHSAKQSQPKPASQKNFQKVT